MLSQGSFRWIHNTLKELPVLVGEGERFTMQPKNSAQLRHNIHSIQIDGIERHLDLEFMISCHTVKPNLDPEFGDSLSWTPSNWAQKAVRLMVDIVWQRMMTLVMKFCPLSLLSARDEAQTSNIKKYSNYLELRYLIWLQVTVSSDQAKKEKSQDDTSGRPRFQKKSCALDTHFEDRSKFFREQAVKIKYRDHRAVNSISVQGRRNLWCCFEIFG